VRLDVLSSLRDRERNLKELGCPLVRRGGALVTMASYGSEIHHFRDSGGSDRHIQSKEHPPR
jgi:hypothetical protein